MNLPGTLDVLLRDLHLLCDDDDPGVDDWHLAGGDPEQAAVTLAMAIWELARNPTDQEYAVLERLSDLVALPVPRHSPVDGLGRTFGDVEDPGPATTTIGQPGPGRTSDHPPGPQLRGELLAQCTAGLDEQGAVDRLVRHLHLRVVGIGRLQPAGDLLW